jgi:hypothetical protein
MIRSLERTSCGKFEYEINKIMEENIYKWLLNEHPKTKPRKVKRVRKVKKSVYYPHFIQKGY